MAHSTYEEITVHRLPAVADMAEPIVPRSLRGRIVRLILLTSPSGF